MARLTTVCKKPILLDIRSMVTVFICSITIFLLHFLGYEKPSAWCESACSVWNKENSYVLFWNFAAVDYGLVACQASVLALTHELAQQIEKAMYIEVCSSQLWAYFLPICLQQYAWIYDKYLLAPNPETKYISAPNSSYSMLCSSLPRRQPLLQLLLYGFLCVWVAKNFFFCCAFLFR